jgi:riboflavin synthase
MFTGLVEETGWIRAIEWNEVGVCLQIEASPSFLSDVKVGDSIAVNGCCLTVVALTASTWSCQMVKETLDRTSFRTLQIGEGVNLEKAVKLQDRLGGHLVQGHIDGIGHIQTRESLEDGSWWVTIAAPTSLLRYVIHKGSIAVEGVSLTVANLEENTFSFAMIPHTAQVTTLGHKKIGDPVNLEVDMIAKYIERLIQP